MQKTNPRNTMLRSGASFALGHRKFIQIVESGRKWPVWLAALVYGERPVGDIPRAFPIPARCTSAKPRLPRSQVWRRLGNPTAGVAESEELGDDDDDDTDRAQTSGEED